MTENMAAGAGQEVRGRGQGGLGLVLSPALQQSKIQGLPKSFSMHSDTMQLSHCGLICRTLVGELSACTSLALQVWHFVFF